MSAVRPLEPEDLPKVAEIYADFVEWDDEHVPATAEFFRRLVYEDPFADPEVPPLVYDDPEDGVVALRCVHHRPFVLGDRELRIACAGPMVVDSDHRGRGIATALLERYFDGPQDISSGDRAVDAVHSVWERRGTTHHAWSVGWSRVLAPAGLLAGAAARRRGMERTPAGGLISALETPLARRLEPEPPTGTTEPLTNQALIDLMPDLEEQFPLRPVYSDDYLTWLFEMMELVNLGRLVRRLVRDDDGRPAGSYVMYVNPQWRAHVIQVAAAGDDVGLVLDHLMHDAAKQGAVEVQGRAEAHLLPYLRERRMRIVWADWAHVKSDDPELVNTVLSGRAFLTRMEGEWWIRPRPGVV